MICEKCGQGEMQLTKVRKFSGCLVAIGYTLWIPAIVILILTTMFAYVGTKATGEAASKGFEKAKTEAINNLETINGLPQIVIDDFKDDQSIKQSTLDSLKPAMRERVNSVILTYSASVAGTGIGTGAAATVGGGLTVILYVIFLPALIVGFLLTLKKKSMKCPACGFFFEVAK